MRNLVPILILPLSACLGIPGSGVPEARDLSLGGPIATLELENFVDVRITVGDVDAGTLTCDDNLMPYLETLQRGDALIVRTQPGVMLLPRTACALDLQVTELGSVRLGGSGNITSDDALDQLAEIRSGGSGNVDLFAAGAADLNVHTSGSGRVTVDEVTALGELIVTCSGSGSQDLAGIDMQRVEAELSGSGRVSLAGAADELDATLSGSGDLDAFDLTVQVADVRIGGSGRAEVHATEQVTARLTGSGNLIIEGPASITADVSGSGNVHQR